VPACVLVVADPERIAELVAALSAPLPSAHDPGLCDLLISSGGDDTIDLFHARRPAVVVVTATLRTGDSKSLIETLRRAVAPGEVAIVVVGDDAGPIRTARDAIDLEPNRFVTRPLSDKELRFAVAIGVDAVAVGRGAVALPQAMPAPVTTVLPAAEDAAASARAALRARWAALADSIGGDESLGPEGEPGGDDDDMPPPVVIHPRSPRPPTDEMTPPPAWRGEPAAPSEWSGDQPSAPLREPTLIIPDDPPPAPIATPMELSQSRPIPVPLPPPPALDSDIIAPQPLSSSRTTQDELADPTSTLGSDRDQPTEPRSRHASEPPHTRANTEDRWLLSRPPARQRDDTQAVPTDGEPTVDSDPVVARTNTVELSSLLSSQDRARYLAEIEPHDSVVVAERGPDEHWSKPMLIAELPDRDSRRDLRAAAVRASRSAIDELAFDDFDDDDLLGDDAPAALADLAPARPRRARISDAPLTAPTRVKTVVPAQVERSFDGATRGEGERPGGRDFARQLRAKMSQMAQRLFQGAEAAQPRPDDLAPRHDHHTEIDLASLGDDIALGAGVTELEARHAARLLDAAHTTSPGSWDTHVRERGLADQGDIQRGVSDAALLLAKMFAHASTGRVTFRRVDPRNPPDVEKVVYFDQGRPVFASSNEPGDRMGELLVREGKITASQYERCQVHVAESGRRMGEILVDFGYLKRRELLPAVRRHVEDILYSLFGWSTGRYHVVIDPTPCAERIRLSRHPASLVLEGIRRKLDRTTLERLVGPPSTVIEVPDRDKLGGIVNLADLAAEERAALVAFDGQADLSVVARAAMIDVADVLPLAWGLCVLGLAIARRADTEVPDESTALVGETDLAIDRERVRARWQLVTEADYFALLGVRREATGFEIRRAYQAARRDFAADCFPNDLRRELAQELEDIAHVLDEAFRVLRDDRLRLTYLSNLVE
jgi:hypothetical protein